MIYFFQKKGYNFLKIYKGGDSNDEVACQAFPRSHTPDPGSALCRLHDWALITQTDNCDYFEKEVFPLKFILKLFERIAPRSLDAIIVAFAMEH